ncbi:MAG: hypothetical protein IKQ46_08380 [Bacteroidales bacterium]|nr:hypothetical protein [Bacteroidales bacterium]
MKTIFDFNPTDEELARFGGRKTYEEGKKNGLDITNPIWSDANYYQIGVLLSMRGDKAMADMYFSKIKDKRILRSLWQDCP